MCMALTDDQGKFREAAAALESMVTSAGKRKRKVFKLDVPLLVFVTSEKQYPNWSCPQAYMVSVAHAMGKCRVFTVGNKGQKKIRRGGC